VEERAFYDRGALHPRRDDRPFEDLAPDREAPVERAVPIVAARLRRAHVEADVPGPASGRSTGWGHESLREPPESRRFVRSSGRTRRVSPINDNSPDARAIVPSTPTFGTRTAREVPVRRTVKVERDSSMRVPVTGSRSAGDAGNETDAPRISPARASRSTRERAVWEWGSFGIDSPTRLLRTAGLPGGVGALAQNGQGTGDVGPQGPHAARARRRATHGGHSALPKEEVLVVGDPTQELLVREASQVLHPLKRHGTSGASSSGPSGTAGTSSTGGSSTGIGLGRSATPFTTISSGSFAVGRMIQTLTPMAPGLSRAW